MTDTTSERAAPARKQAAPIDPVKGLTAALYDDGVSDGARKAARAEFCTIASAGRAWEQLPSGLKTAARADVLRLSEAGGKVAALTSSGYTAGIAARLLRDIGRT